MWVRNVSFIQMTLLLYITCCVFTHCKRSSWCSEASTFAAVQGSKSSSHYLPSSDSLFWFPHRFWNVPFSPGTATGFCHIVGIVTMAESKETWFAGIVTMEETDSYICSPLSWNFPLECSRGFSSPLPPHPNPILPFFRDFFLPETFVISVPYQR